MLARPKNHQKSVAPHILARPKRKKTCSDPSLYATPVITKVFLDNTKSVVKSLHFYLKWQGLKLTE